MSIVGLSTALSLLGYTDSFLSHFCILRNTQKLVTEYKDPYVRKVAFLDTYKFFYHTGGCFAHMVGFMPVIPLMYATMQDLSVDVEKLWWLDQYASKAIYTTQVIFFVRCVE